MPVPNLRFLICGSSAKIRSPGSFHFYLRGTLWHTWPHVVFFAYCSFESSMLLTYLARSLPHGLFFAVLLWYCLFDSRMLACSALALSS